MSSSKVRRSQLTPSAPPQPPAAASRATRAPGPHGKPQSHRSTSSPETASFHPGVAGPAPEQAAAIGPDPAWLTLLGPFEEHLGRLRSDEIDAVRDLINEVVPPYRSDEIEHATRSTVVGLARTLPGPVGRSGRLAQLLAAYRAELEAERSGVSVPGTPLRLLGAETGSSFAQALEQGAHLLATHAPDLARHVAEHLGIVREGKPSLQDDRWCLGTWSVPWPESGAPPELRVVWVACELVGESARVAFMREIDARTRAWSDPADPPFDAEGPRMQMAEEEEQAEAEVLVHNAASCVAELEHADTLRALLSSVPLGTAARRGLDRHLNQLMAYLPGAFQAVHEDLPDDPPFEAMRAVMQERFQRRMGAQPVASTRVM